ncbi:Tn3 family transposase, partial [Escherichia coli]
LRRRVHAGLNKGEARNSLARAVFFNRLGEIRDRSFEQQRYRHRSESGAAHKLCLSINKNAKRLMLSWLNIRTSATGNPINAVRTVPSGSLRERSGRKRKRSPAQYIRKHLPKYGRASAIQLRLLCSGC